MNLNPYQPPRPLEDVPEDGEIAPRIRQVTFANLWRDRKYLVLDRSRARFHPVCLLTNRWAKDRMVLRLHAPEGDRLQLEVPVDDAWHDLRQSRLMSGWSLIFASAMLLVLCPMVWPPWQHGIAAVSFISPLFPAALGFIALRWFVPALPRLCQLQGSLVWLDGVNADYLAALPVWDSSQVTSEGKVEL